MSNVLNIKDDQWDSLMRIIQLASFNDFMMASPNAIPANCQFFIDNYLDSLDKVKDFCRIISFCFSDALELKVQDQVAIYGNDVERMLTFASSKFTIDDFIFHSQKYVSKNLKAIRNKTTLSLYIDIKDLRLKKLPAYFFFVVGATLGYQTMPSSESWLNQLC